MAKEKADSVDTSDVEAASVIPLKDRIEAFVALRANPNNTEAQIAAIDDALAKLGYQPPKAEAKKSHKVIP